MYLLFSCQKVKPKSAVRFRILYGGPPQYRPRLARFAAERPFSTGKQVRGAETCRPLEVLYHTEPKMQGGNENFCNYFFAKSAEKGKIHGLLQLTTLFSARAMLYMVPISAIQTQDEIRPPLVAQH